jgi:hypothetical protein
MTNYDEIRTCRVCHEGIVSRKKLVCDECHEKSQERKCGICGVKVRDCCC